MARRSRFERRGGRPLPSSRLRSMVSIRRPRPGPCSRRCCSIAHASPRAWARRRISPTAHGASRSGNSSTLCGYNRPDAGCPSAPARSSCARLVRLGDDRDLRQLPAAAQHLDAVRLVTIHGAKGLEFGGVHIPGLNSDTIPRTPPAPPCPAPDGMIAGAEGRVRWRRSAQVEAEEQECLFYVAQSRARDRLILCADREE